MRPTLAILAARLGHAWNHPEPEGWRAVSDSRAVRPGDLFIALPGERVDGHDFVAAVLEAGAAAVVADPARLPAGLRLDPRVLAATDTRAALLELGAAARDVHTGPLVAITGSNGKTTTKELAAHLLSRHYHTASSQGNQNSTLGAPLSLLNALDGHGIYVMEAGMSQPGEIARLCEMARPTHGLVTNIQPAHLEGTGGLEAVAREKGQLFRWLAENNGTALVNLDDPRVVEQASRNRRRSGYALRNHSAGAVHILEEAGADEQARFRLRLSGHECVLPVPGQAFLECAAAAAAIALELGMDAAGVTAGLATFSGAPGRMQVRRDAGWTLLDDSYNANPASMRAALDTLSRMAALRRVAVLGEMRELGGESRNLHAEVGRHAAGLGIDLILLAGSPEARAAFVEGLEAGGRTAHRQSEDAGGLLGAFTARPGDVVLLKGSRLTGLDRLAREWMP
jgi:UDP-N-acetylmuramoyl-tripeptide--D-alanyl-D-alanine ligase